MRKAASTALAKLGEHAASAVPQLTTYLEHADADVRKAAADALSKKQVAESARAHSYILSDRYRKQLSFGLQCSRFGC